MTTCAPNLESIRLEVNVEKTRLTTFDEGFTYLGVSFKGRKYRYEWYGKTVEADGRGEAIPLEVDGYR